MLPQKAADINDLPLGDFSSAQIHVPELLRPHPVSPFADGISP
jgi:hypothetical protein